MRSVTSRAELRTRVLPVLLVVLLSLGLHLPALAQADELSLVLRDSDFAADGSTTMVVNVTGAARPDVLGSDAFMVTENGEPVPRLTVEPLLESEEVSLTVTMALDVSGSMAGEPLESMKAAAIQTVETLTAQEVSVGLISFATAVDVVTEPSQDAAALTAAIQDLEAAGRTALHDGVIAGVDQLAGLEGVKALVVFADGGDNESSSTLADAIAAANAAEVSVTVVAFETPDLDPESLRPLSEETEGGFFTPAEPVEFSEALSEVTEDVASQYVLSYRSDLYEPAELDLAVTVAAAGAEASTAFVVANPREAFAVGDAPAPAPAPMFDAGIFGRSGALFAALGIAFLAVALVLLLLFYPRRDREASRTLRRGVTMVQRGEGEVRLEGGTYASTIAQSAIGLVSRAPKPEGYDERLQNDIDRAGWNLRAGELTTLRVVLTLLGFVLSWWVTGSLVVSVLLAIAAAVLPRLLLNRAKSRRQARFMAQLPDALQLLSGTLKSGYGVLQAIDTVVKEVEDPMSSEFQRALTEARLGLPLEDSLGSMADRIDSDDFRWVVVAMNIQRQVGGNLAELLDTVAETLRGREQIRRQIQVLSAEGRLSAVILFVLPFGLLGYLLIVNPEYLLPLFTNQIGWIAMIVAAVLMVLGAIWIRRLIKIEV
ncbi:MAG: VWA domain-containing protein [Nitriliruptor sp.]|nr:MAG: VWA domain-containing protein [Nitriliruptor sp.]